MTARAHELPGVLAVPVAWIVQLLGAEVALDRAHVGPAGHGDRRPHRDDVGAVARSGHGWCRRGRQRVADLSSSPATPLARAANAAGAHGCVFWSLVTLAWVPCAWRSLVALVLHQQLRADVAAFPNVGQTLVSTWVHVGLACAVGSGAEPSRAAGSGRSPADESSSRPDPARCRQIQGGRFW